MWFQNYFTSLTATPTRRRPVRRSPRASRLGIETLEDRRLLTFNPVASFPVGTTPAAVASADFNGDGRLDLATANAGSNSVSVLLGNGNGEFDAANEFAAGAGLRSVAAGDFNNDSKLDLATANFDYYGTGESNVNILFGNGDGTFAPAIAQSLFVPYGSNMYSGYIATGHLNDDGKLDLVVTSDDGGDFACNMSVLLGNGNGSFTDASWGNFYLGTLSAPVLADVNGDGNTDVAVAHWDAQYGFVKVFLGTGYGFLQAPTDVVTNWGPESLAIGDFNADGNLDLATAHFASYPSIAGTASLLLGNGNGTFQAPQSFATGSGSAAAATAGDLNADGKPDLVVISHGGSVSVLLGNGNGSFAPPITAAAGSYSSFAPPSVVMADFNADGRLDAATTNADSNAVAVLLNDGVWTVPNLPRISISDVAKSEGNAKTTNFTFTITLSAAYSQAVKVNYATANGTAKAGSDYQSKTGTVTFAPGEKSKTITVAVIGDKLKESNETFFLNLSGAIGGVITDSQGVGTIVSDDGGSSNGKLASFALAVDAAIDDWTPSGRKKRNR